MTKPERPVKDSSLLSKRERLGLTCWRISKQVPRGSGETESTDIGAGLMSGVVFGFALG
jgi:hypothetical protein